MTTEQNTLRCGFVALVGQPNAGKSTLMNALLAHPVSIVSRKAQTTRFPLKGIVTHKGSQIILIDTPGLFHAKNPLERSMIRAAHGAPLESHVTLVLIDVSAPLPPQEKLCEPFLKNTPKPWIVLNKIDRIKRTELLPLAARYADNAEHIFMIAATKQDGTDKLLNMLAQAMPHNDWLFQEEVLTTLPESLWASEITREVILENIHEEIPHKLYVAPESWKSLRDKSVRITQVIHVAKPTHKQILLGQGGETIKRLSTAARTRIEKRMGINAHLVLFVRHTPETMTHFYTHIQQIGLLPKDSP